MSGEVVSSEDLLECLGSVEEEVTNMLEYIDDMAEACPERDFSGFTETLSQLQSQLRVAMVEELESMEVIGACGACEHCQEEISFEDALYDAVQEVVAKYAGAKVIKSIKLDIGSVDLH